MVFLRMLGLSSLIIATPTVAQIVNPSARVTEMIACRSINGNAARLACFDRAAASVEAAQTKGDLVIIDRKTVLADKQARFGLTQSKNDVFGGGAADKATAFTQIDTTVRVAKPAAATGRWNVELADGSVWQTIDALPLLPKAGDAIIVKQAALGGYRATIGRQRSILIKRLR